MPTKTKHARVWMNFGVAQEQVAAIVPLTAADDGGAEPPGRWHAILTVEGLRTTDHRRIAPDALIWRELPLPILWQIASTWGHDGAVIVGAIESIERDAATGKIMGTGTWDLGGDNGREAARLSAGGFLRWVSVDLEVLASELVEIGTPPWVDDWDFWSVTAAADTLEYDWYEEITEGRIMGTTMLPFPAFPQAVIAPEGTTLPDVPPMGDAPIVDSGLIACAAPDLPPAAWFTDPQLSGPTILTINDDGRVFGHIAAWGTCHTGFPDVCVCPPKSATNYAHATTGGAVKTAEGTLVRVGHLTMATGHAGLNMDHRAAAAHYDDTGTAVVDWVYGEDDHGIWAAGCLRAGVTEDQVRNLRASAVSGDWRDVGGGLELVAALAVNVPGFPIPASGAPRRLVGLTASGERLALVAAGRIERDPLRPIKEALSQIAARLVAVEGVTGPLQGLAVEKLRERIAG